MNRQWNKNIYRGLLLLTFLAVNALIIFGISSVFHYLNSGADRAKMLHLSTEIDAAYTPKIVWNTNQNEGRVMEAQTLQNINKDYRNAWYFKNRAYAHNTNSGLNDYFTKQLRLQLEQYIALNLDNNTRIRQTSLEHYPKLEFYSADGKIVAFTDHGVRIYEKIYHGEQLIHVQEKVRSYKVVMMLEDGIWRIRHIVEIQNIQVAKEASVKVVLKSERSIKGINYYPQEHPWDLFDEAVDSELIASDFERIREMGLNTVRIFVPYSNFGGAKLSAKKLNRLIKIMDLAEKQNLKVLITLFDFYGNYELEDWTLTHRHAEVIVKALKEHPALLAWDIKNEPDLDFKSRGKENVLAWLSEMNNQIKNWDKQHPVTIGWSSPEAATELHSELDFVSFHYYRAPEELSSALAELKEKVPDKLIILEEYGHSSYNGFWNLFSSSEEDQANYYQLMQAILKKEQLPYMAWTLYDFERIPTNVIGRLPWRKLPQKHYGLIDIKGNQKAALGIFVGKE